MKLSRRVARLEARLTKAAPQIRTGSLDAKIMYEPSEEELTKAMEILVACGAMREVESDSSSATPN